MDDFKVSLARAAGRIKAENWCQLRWGWTQEGRWGGSLGVRDVQEALDDPVQGGVWAGEASALTWYLKLHNTGCVP